MNTAFSHALRVLICPGCGAAVHVPVRAGEAGCEVCEQVLTLTARDERVGAELLTKLGEPERLARLRSQDRARTPLPDALVRFVKQGLLRPDMASEAMAEWQLSRAASIGGAAGAEERFYHLTLLLGRHLSGRGDDTRLRALLETAFESLPSPRHRQVVRATLARLAAAAGDGTAAADWLEGCDAHAVDLHSDAAYRAAAASIATLRRDYPQVLELVGRHSAVLPVSADDDAVLSVLRANAHEKLGDVEAAVAELRGVLARLSGDGVAVAAVLREHAPLGLCARSGGRVAGALSTHGAPRGGAGAQIDEVRRGRGPRLLRSAALWFSASMALLMAAVAVGPDRTAGPGWRVDLLLLVGAIGLALPVVVPGVLRGARRRS